ncbi:hypothetical protein DFQ30_011089, partial [Apophysomyces sp. BC1015]
PIQHFLNEITMNNNTIITNATATANVDIVNNNTATAVAAAPGSGAPMVGKMVNYPAPEDLIEREEAKMIEATLCEDEGVAGPAQWLRPQRGADFNRVECAPQ